jgi:hypothetical protein
MHEHADLLKLTIVIMIAQVTYQQRLYISQS